MGTLKSKSCEKGDANAVNEMSLSSHYAVKALADSDIPAALALCKSNPQFYAHCPPPPSEESIRRARVALPPRKQLQDKYYLGFWDGEALVALMDLILRYPNEQTAFIGFFMVDARDQGRGVGSAIVTRVLSRLSEKFSAVRLGYVRGNEQSRHFWEKNGFTPTGVIAREERYDIVIMQRALGGENDVAAGI